MACKNQSQDLNTNRKPVKFPFNQSNLIITFASGQEW